jgi:hypothetical protein
VAPDAQGAGRSRQRDDTRARRQIGNDSETRSTRIAVQEPPAAANESLNTIQFLRSGRCARAAQPSPIQVIPEKPRYREV